MSTRVHLRIALAAPALALALASLAPTRSAAQEFSANVVTTPPQGSQTSRIYVGKNKVRIQTLDQGQPAGGVIFDVDSNSAIILNDKDHSYIGGGNDAVANAMLSGTGVGALWRFFRPLNAGSPCDDWNDAVKPLARFDSTKTPPQFACTSLGDESVNGRSARKWAVVSTVDGKTDNATVWIDHELHVVSKSQDTTEVEELRNIAEGSQPDSLFAIPAGYKQLDLTALLSHLKDGKNVDPSVSGMLGDVATRLKQDAKRATTDAAEAKANDAMKKKIKKLFHAP